ncbi:MAG: peptidoglycan DD-metalloendopeptidase family protein, partial [Leptospiraceae bacterium]|nr:peptidoglycan DD-metalloendopeptidase family protein [Leptospiraceae bacterium]
PNYEPFRNNLSWSLLLYAESLQENDPERALEILKEAYDFNPRYREAVRRYANGLVDAKQYGRALDVLQQGMRTISENDSFCWPLSVAYREHAQELVQENKQSQALQISRGIRNYINGKPDCDNVLLIAIDKNFAMLNAFEEAMPLLEELAARHGDHSVYSQRAGFHINRYAVRLRTTGHTEQAASMRDRANVHLRRAMDIYERNHPGRPVVRDVGFPLRDMTMVVASHDSGGTHSGYGKYCYDFITVGSEGAAIRPDTRGDNLNDFYGFGASVYAVREGVVDVSKDTDPDFAPNAVQYDTDGNFVRVKHADGTFSWYVHLKQNSVTVNAGDRVRAGQKIGELGNSGMSVSPHLHFCMIGDDYVSLDFRFESMRIRPTLTDAPRATTDPLRMGWLVQPTP